MPWRGVLARSSWALVAVLLLAAAGGCRLTRSQVLMSQLPPEGPSPRELTKISLPTYVIEPPDVLLIDAVKVVPKPPYHIEPLDTLEIFVLGTLPDQSIAGPFPVEADGTIMLGPAYGAIKVSGLTLAEARDAVRTQLEGVLTAPEVSVSLSESAGQQQIEGEHLVGPDGTVNLGTYGSVYIAGMTISEARTAIEEHLKEFLDEPEVSVDVFAYNSKFYYVVTEGAGLGDQIQRVPITGNETVLDAITQVGGLSRISSKTIWVARPAPADGSGSARCCPSIGGPSSTPPIPRPTGRSCPAIASSSPRTSWWPWTTSSTRSSDPSNESWASTCSPSRPSKPPTDSLSASPPPPASSADRTNLTRADLALQPGSPGAEMGC